MSSTTRRRSSARQQVAAVEVSPPRTRSGRRSRRSLAAAQLARSEAQAARPARRRSTRGKKKKEEEEEQKVQSSEEEEESFVELPPPSPKRPAAVSRRRTASKSKTKSKTKSKAKAAPEPEPAKAKKTLTKRKSKTGSKRAVASAAKAKAKAKPTDERRQRKYKSTTKKKKVMIKSKAKSKSKKKSSTSTPSSASPINLSSLLLLTLQCVVFLFIWANILVLTLRVPDSIIPSGVAELIKPYGHLLEALQGAPTYVLWFGATLLLFLAQAASQRSHLSIPSSPEKQFTDARITFSLWTWALVISSVLVSRMAFPGQFADQEALLIVAFAITAENILRARLTSFSELASQAFFLGAIYILSTEEENEVTAATRELLSSIVFVRAVANIASSSTKRNAKISLRTHAVAYLPFIISIGGSVALIYPYLLTSPASSDFWHSTTYVSAIVFSEVTQLIASYN